MASLHRFVHSVNTCVANEDGAALARLLLATDANVFREAQDQAFLERACGTLPANFDEIVYSHCRCQWLVLQSQFHAAFEQQLKVMEAFLAEISADRPNKTNWYLRPIDAAAKQFRMVAYKADAESRQSGHSKLKYSIQVPDLLQRFFRKFIVDKAPLNVSKKMGALFIVVHMFKVYFRINNLRLCSNVVKAVHGQTFPALDHFPKSQTVAFNYYFGRLKVFEAQYAEAEEALSFAFDHCLNVATSNKRRILEFLVPVRAYLGRLPHPDLLKKYNLDELFGDLLRAIRAGRLSAFDVALRKNQEYFIRRGMFLLLEKLRMLVYRNMFKRILIAQKQRENNTKKTFVPLSVFQLGLKVDGINADYDELECVLTNLIYDGFLKGYIAHRRGVMTRPTNPFPSVAEVLRQ